MTGDGQAPVGDGQVPRHRDGTRRGRGAIAVGVLTAVVSGAAVAYAMWSAGAAADAAVLRAGDLDVALDGPATWTETSTDVAGAPRTIDAADFLAMPGDVVVLTQDFTTTLEGDNIAAQLTVSWDGREATVPDGVSATYQVHDADGDAVTVHHADGDAMTTPVVGETVIVPEMPVGEEPWTLRVELVLDADAAVTYSEGTAPAGPAPLADLGELILDLQQVRSGPGVGS